MCVCMRVSYIRYECVCLCVCVVSFDVVNFPLPPCWLVAGAVHIPRDCHRRKSGGSLCGNSSTTTTTSMLLVSMWSVKYYGRAG